MASAPNTRPRRLGDEEHQGSPFHEGEQHVQARVGVRERIERMGRMMVRDAMPREHGEFFEALPFLVVGSADARGDVWASLLIGEPGFVQAPSERILEVRAQPLPGDPLRASLLVGAPLGLLGIELSTRRRNRANGRIARVSDGAFELSVEQSFGNCKQYIQPRAGSFAAPEARLAPAAEGAELSAEALQILARAETSFIATSSRDAERGGNQGLDVSHRGGPPGFIHAQRLDGATLLTLPDYYGNFMFNTFGNLEVNPHAGFLVLDFASGALLSLTGTARVLWDDPRQAAFPDAERLLELEVKAGWLWRDVLQGWA
jgi:predicted pyridoxine 5'-phosphate oxidase superfamily flavin-nucleotide-binding protein